MVPSIVLPSRRSRNAVRLVHERRIAHEGLERRVSLATMVVRSQHSNIHLTRSGKVSTAQVHNQDAIHENPHVVVTGKFKHFGIRDLVQFIVLELGITHHREVVVAQMAETDCRRARSSNGRICIARATIFQPALAKRTRILLEEVRLV